MAKYDFGFLEGKKLYDVHELPECTELHYTGSICSVYDKDEIKLISEIIDDALRYASDDVMGYTQYYLLNPAEYIEYIEITTWLAGFH